MHAEKDFQEMLGIVDSHKFSWSCKDNFFSFYPLFTRIHKFYRGRDDFFVRKNMGYYRKGHFRSGKWISGHYVSTFGRKRRKSNSPQGCAVIFWGGIISFLLYMLG
jgi:hypothetical protein